MSEPTACSLERLAVSDAAILQFRRITVDAAREFQVIGRVAPYIPHAKLCSLEGVVPRTKDWRTLGVSAEELALAPLGEAAE